jgi:hypothetical protein
VFNLHDLAFCIAYFACNISMGVFSKHLGFLLVRHSIDFRLLLSVICALCQRHVSYVDVFFLEILVLIPTNVRNPVSSRCIDVGAIDLGQMAISLYSSRCVGFLAICWPLASMVLLNLFLFSFSLPIIGLLVYHYFPSIIIRLFLECIQLISFYVNLSELTKG